MNTIAHNIANHDLFDDIRKLKEAERQATGYMDKIPYVETWYFFRDGSALEYLWGTGKVVAHAP